MTTESDMTYEQALRKVAGLLKLASKASTPEEAAAAGAKASELMQRFQIEKDMALEGAPEKDETIGDAGEALDVMGERISWWKWRLAQCLFHAHSCMGYLSQACDEDALRKYREGIEDEYGSDESLRSDKHWQKRIEKRKSWLAARDKFTKRTIGIVGRPSDIAAVRYLYMYLREQIDQLTAELGKGQGKTWRNNFRLGAIEMIDERFGALRRQMLAEMRAKHGFVPTHEIVLTYEDAPTKTILVRKVDQDLYKEDEWGKPDRPAWRMFRDDTTPFCRTDEDIDVSTIELRTLANVENPFALIRLEAAIAKSEKKQDESKAWASSHMNLSSLRRSESTHDSDGRSAGRQAGERMSLGGGARGALGAGKKGLGSGQ